MQIGSMTVIFLYMGSVLDEKRRGTAALMMMKGLSRLNFIAAKFFAGAVSIFIVIAVSVLIAHAYTLILFGEAAATADMLLGGLIFYIFTLLTLAITIFFSTIAKSTAISATLSLVTSISLALISSIQRISDVSPFALATRALEITFGFYHERLWISIVLALLFIDALLLSSVYILSKKEL
jgi:ABC-2 type transport system permease protein